MCVSCASKPTPKPDPAEVELAKAMTSIADSMETLAQIESAEREGDYSVKTYGYDEYDLPAIWLAEINLVEDYHGDIQKFIEMISAIGGLESPRIDVPRAGRPVTVAIAKGKRKLISFLADAGHQAGDSATVSPSIHLNKVVVTFK